MSWTEPPNPYGKIVKYVVYYREKENERNEKKVVRNGLSVLLTSLVLDTEYYISVQAFTVAGGGKWSERILHKSSPGRK